MPYDYDAMSIDEIAKLTEAELLADGLTRFPELQVAQACGREIGVACFRGAGLRLLQQQRDALAEDGRDTSRLDADIAYAEKHVRNPVFYIVDGADSIPRVG